MTTVVHIIDQINARLKTEIIDRDTDPAVAVELALMGLGSADRHLLARFFVEGKASAFAGIKQAVSTMLDDPS